MSIFNNKAILSIFLILVVLVLGFGVYTFINPKSESSKQQSTSPTQTSGGDFLNQVSEVLEKSNVLFEGEIKTVSSENQKLTVILLDERKKEVSVAFDSKTILFRQPFSQEQNATQVPFSDLREGMLVVIYGSEAIDSAVVAEGIGVRIQPTIDFKTQSEMKKILNPDPGNGQ
jgi:hypothetical protein